MSLVVAGRESRKVRITIEVEGALVGLVGHHKVERVRFADGKWRNASLFFQRLEALGAKPDFGTVKVGERGEHSPIY